MAIFSCSDPQCILAKAPGFHRTKKGYLRIHQRGPWRNWYLHRWVLMKLGLDIQALGLEVHHQDGNEANPCPMNLIAMPWALHQTGQHSNFSSDPTSPRYAAKFGRGAKGKKSIQELQEDPPDEFATLGWEASQQALERTKLYAITTRPGKTAGANGD